MMDNILEAYGFEREIGGGGCQLLTHYIDGGGFVWATCLDGGGLPDTVDWMVCAYGEDLDDILYEFRSDENERGLSLAQAVVEAVEVAEAFHQPCKGNRHTDSGRGVCVDCGEFLI